MTLKNDARSSPYLSAGQSIRFSHLTVENGLAHNITNSMVQDQQGFIWIAGFDGLNRFDGYEFKVFRHDPDNPHSLSDNMIRAMTIDSTGLIWIATQTGGINKFDPVTETFTCYRHQPENRNSLGVNVAVSIFVDRSGLIWIGGDSELDQFDPQTETFVRYCHNPTDPTTVGHGHVHTIVEDRYGTLWIGNRGGGGLSRFDRATQCFTRYTHNPDDPHSLSSDVVHALYVDRNGVLWVGTEDRGLNRFDRNTETFTHYRHNPHNHKSVSDDYIRDILEDQAGHLWIATVAGLNLMDRAAGTFMRYQHNPADPTSLTSDNISRLFEDRAGGLWLTTFKGVNYCYPLHQHFDHYRHDPNNPNSLDHNYVRSVYEDSTGILWIGTEKGLNKFDRAQNRITHYQPDPDNPNSLSANIFVTALLEDADHKLWVGTWGGELNLFDPQTEQFKRFGPDPADPTDPVIDYVSTLCEDQNQDIWVGAYHKGLYRFDREKQRFGCYAHNPDDPHSLSSNSVFVIYEDRAGVLWVGTEDSGLNRFDRATETFTHYRHDPQNPDSISSDGINTIIEDCTGALWIGTNNGLNHFNRKTETFKSYGEKQGMPNAVGLGIIEETPPTGVGSYLWMSTNKGLVKFDPQQEIFRSYDVADGAQSAFSQNAYFKGVGGEMFFGGVNGLTAFYPERIIHNDDLPAIVITNFLLFNKPVPIGADSPLQKAIWATEHLTLSDQDYSFAFEFAALSYLAPDKNRYKYKLEGFEEEWNEVDSKRRYAAYTNLPAGEYVFRVIGSNNHGVWNEEGAAIKITVAQPWWEKLKAEKEAAELARRAAEAASQAKSVFLANMSHELRTPLNAILGFCQIMQRNPSLAADLQENLNIINRSGEHLLDLINDIMEMSKIEAGRVTLNENNFDLYRLLDDLENMLHLRATDKGLQLRFERAPDVPQYIRTDEGKLREVLINLLGNAIKFTKEGGVTLRVSRVSRVAEQRGSGATEIERASSLSPRPPACQLHFEVSDTGPGIAPNELDNIFEPFIQTESGRQSQRGTGLGLSISREFVQLMGSEINVRSEIGQGTIFRFDIHVSQVEAAALPTTQPSRRVIGLAPNQPVYRLLVVDDQADGRRLLVKLLEPLGFEVKEAGNGQEALEIWEQWRPDLIWLDIRMPVLDGYEAAKKIRATPDGPFTIIIALTASVFEEERAEVLSSGCNDFVRKPFQEAEIFNKLAEHLGVRYVYEDLPVRRQPLALREGSRIEDLKAEIGKLPAELVARLAEATELSDMELIDQVIANIHRHNARLAKALSNLARDFRYEEILALVQEQDSTTGHF